MYHFHITEMDTLTKDEIEKECKRQEDIDDADEEIRLVKQMIEDSNEDIKKLDRQQFVEADELCDRQQKEIDDLIDEHLRIRELLKDEHLRQMNNCKELLTDHEEHLAIVEGERQALIDHPLVIPEDFELYHT